MDRDEQVSPCDIHFILSGVFIFFPRLERYSDQTRYEHCFSFFPVIWLNLLGHKSWLLVLIVFSSSPTVTLFVEQTNLIVTF